MIKFSGEQWKDVVNGYQISNYGRLRRERKNGWYYLIPHYPNKFYYTLYEYNPDGSKKTLHAKDLVEIYFGKTNIVFSESYKEVIRKENKKLNEKITNKEYYHRKRNKDDMGLFVRKCVDCGKETTNYRCSKCWNSIRKEQEENDDYQEYLRLCGNTFDEHKVILGRG